MFVLLAGALVLAASVSVGATLQSYPLLDGSCSEYAALGATRRAMRQDVGLWVYQDADNVWLCLDLAEPDSIWLDLAVDTPALDEPLNLHVSAQLGEWPVSEQGPDRGTSSSWWQIDGWYGTPAQFNGNVDGRGRFLEREALEMVLGKERFGGGDWQLRFVVGGLTGADGSDGLVFPADQDGQPRALTLRVANGES